MPPAKPASRFPWGVSLAVLIIVLTGWAAYRNSFQGPLIFDDLPGIAENASIRHGWWTALQPPENGQTVTGRPLANLSFALNYRWGAYNVWSYHALNLAIHLLAGLTLFGLVRRTLLLPALREKYGDVALLLALSTTLIWTLHPLQTESVTYVVQRAEALMALFYLLTMYCFVRGTESTRPQLWYSGSVVACVAGVFCKEGVMVSAPLMVLLYDRTFIAGNFTEALRKRWTIFMALLATWIPLGWLVWATGTRGDSAGFGAGIDSSLQGLPRLRAIWDDSLQYALTQFRAIVDYLWLYVWPHPITLDHGRDFATHASEIVPYAIVVAGLVAGTVYALWRKPMLGFLGFWFFAILAPSSSIMPIITETMAEHRMYLPLATLAVLTPLGLYVFGGRRALACSFLLVPVLGWVTFERNSDYRLSSVIWADSVVKAPDNARTHENLGISLSAVNRLREAVQEYETALKLRPYYPDCENNLGNTFNSLGEYKDAVDHYLEAIHQMPHLAQAYYNLGNALIAMNQWEQAGAAYAKAAELNPEFAAAHNNYANILSHFGKNQEAIAEYQKAIADQPDFAQAHYNLGNVYINLNQATAAHDQYAAALAAMPNYADAEFGLANSLVLLNKLDEAVPHYMNSIRLNPSLANTYNNLGTTLMQLGRMQEAISAYEQALRLDPNFTAAREALNTARQRVAPLPQ